MDRAHAALSSPRSTASVATDNAVPSFTRDPKAVSPENSTESAG